MTISEDHGDYWNLERITIQAPAKHYKLVFSAKNGLNAILYYCAIRYQKLSLKTVDWDKPVQGVKK